MAYKLLEAMHIAYHNVITGCISSPEMSACGIALVVPQVDFMSPLPIENNQKTSFP